MERKFLACDCNQQWTIGHAIGPTAGARTNTASDKDCPRGSVPHVNGQVAVATDTPRPRASRRTHDSRARPPRPPGLTTTMMLLCVVKGRLACWLLRCGECVCRLCWVRTRQGGAARGARAGSYEVTWSGRPGQDRGRPADHRQASTDAAATLRARPSPGSGALAGGAQVAVDLAGDVTLQAADDLLLRQAFGGAPSGVGAGRGM